MQCDSRHDHTITSRSRDSLTFSAHAHHHHLHLAAGHTRTRTPLSRPQSAGETECADRGKTAPLTAGQTNGTAGEQSLNASLPNCPTDVDGADGADCAGVTVSLHARAGWRGKETAQKRGKKGKKSVQRPAHASVSSAIRWGSEPSRHTYRIYWTRVLPTS